MEETIQKTINLGQALADYILTKNYGDIVRYQEIENVTGLLRKTGNTYNSKYYNTINKAKKILIDNGKAIKRIEGGDYRILYPGDYSDAYVSEVKKARNRIKRGGKLLKNAPISDMDTKERETFRQVSDFHANLEAKMYGQYVEVKRLSGKTHPFDTQNIRGNSNQ